MLSSNDIDVEKYFWFSPVAQLSLSHPVAWGMGGVWAYSKHQHPCFGPRARAAERMVDVDGGTRRRQHATQERDGDLGRLLFLSPLFMADARNGNCP